MARGSFGRGGSVARRNWVAVAVSLLLLLAAASMTLACDPVQTRSEAKSPKTQEITSPTSKARASTQREGKKAAEAPGRREVAHRDHADALPQPPPGSCRDLLVLVDREHGLPRDYTPDGLVYLSDYGVHATAGGERLRRSPARHLHRLIAAANRDGRELVVGSAYRSYRDQQTSYAHWTRRHGAGAGGVSAPPGHSEHQLGTAVDFTNKAVKYRINQLFGYTKASKWLMKHAYEYGFVLSYPENEKSRTGYTFPRKRPHPQAVLGSVRGPAILCSRS